MFTKIRIENKNRIKNNFKKFKMTLRDLSQKQLREGVENDTIVLEKFYAKFKCKKCRRTWTSHRYCRFRRGGDILSMPLACKKCGQKTHPSSIKTVSCQKLPSKMVFDW